MRIFFLKKWFFDVLLPNQGYVYFYITSLKLFFWKTARINLHLIQDNQMTSVSEKIKLKNIGREKIDFKSGYILNTGRHIEVNLHSGNLGIKLEYHANEASNLCPVGKFIKQRNKEITWRPIMLKAQVAGDINVNGRQVPINNHQGYIDYVFSDILPFNQPISALYWGRLHNNEVDLSYSHALCKKQGKTASKLILRIGEKVFETHNIEIKTIEHGFSEKLEMEFPKIIELHAKLNGVEIELRIDQKKKLIESGFMDEQENIPKIFLGFLKKISKNPRGIKFMSKAQAILKTENPVALRDVMLVSEYVLF